jgi:uncharacterized protein with HEPN domain
LLVEDMLDALRKIDSYTARMDHSAFLEDERTVDAVVRNLEVLGEGRGRSRTLLRRATLTCPGGKLRDCATGLFMTISAWILR